MNTAAPDPLTAFFIAMACFGALGLIFAIAAAIADYSLTPWMERNGPRRLKNKLTFPIRMRALRLRAWFIGRKLRRQTNGKNSFHREWPERIGHE